MKSENAYRTITEVAELLQVQPSVLRFWETQFHQIKPVKRLRRRYYSAENIVLLARIRDLLYNEGFTIKGVQKKLKDEPATSLVSPATVKSPEVSDALGRLLDEIADIRDSLKDLL